VVERDQHRVRRVARARDLLVVDVEPRRALRVAHGEVGGRAEVPRRHQVRVDVVVDERGVLVGAGDGVDPERARGVVVAHRAPQPRRGHQQLEPRALPELLVARGGEIAAHRVGDVRVDVEGGRAGGPYPEHSWPPIVRHGNVTPSSPSSRARARATSIVLWRQRSTSRAAAGAT